MVGLSNVNNTSDISKPISTATQAALTSNTTTLNNAISLKADSTTVSNNYNTLNTAIKLKGDLISQHL